MAPTRSHYISAFVPFPPAHSMEGKEVAPSATRSVLLDLLLFSSTNEEVDQGPSDLEILLTPSLN